MRHDSAPIKPPPGAGPQSRRRRLQLIVADDENDTVTTLSAILSDEGHAVTGVANGPQVFECVRERRPDAVILDIDMPGMSGYTVAREMRAKFQEATPLLIAISGKWVGQTDRMLADLAGFNHFLQKPCDPRVLLQLLEPLVHAPPPAGEKTE